ncbi:MAG: hypothetical protein NTY95_16625 [Bacteroidia bacterium]|nr:hypothetical protein [Bacteroidia bacterium]
MMVTISVKCIKVGFAFGDRRKSEAGNRKPEDAPELNLRTSDLLVTLSDITGKRYKWMKR